MTDHSESADYRTAEKPTDAARQWMRRAALDLVRQAGGRTVTRPAFPQPA